MNEYKVEITVFGKKIQTTIRAKSLHYAREKVEQNCSMKLEKVAQPYDRATTLEEFKKGIKTAAEALTTN